MACVLGRFADSALQSLTYTYVRTDSTPTALLPNPTLTSRLITPKQQTRESKRRYKTEMSRLTFWAGGYAIDWQPIHGKTLSWNSKVSLESDCKYTKTTATEKGLRIWDSLLTISSPMWVMEHVKKYEIYTCLGDPGDEGEVFDSRTHYFWKRKIPLIIFSTRKELYLAFLTWANVTTG